MNIFILILFVYLKIPYESSKKTLNGAKQADSIFKINIFLINILI